MAGPRGATTPPVVARSHHVDPMTPPRSRRRQYQLVRALGRSVVVGHRSQAVAGAHDPLGAQVSWRRSVNDIGNGSMDRRDQLSGGVVSSGRQVWRALVGAAAAVLVAGLGVVIWLGVWPAEPPGEPASEAVAIVPTTAPATSGGLTTSLQEADVMRLEVAIASDDEDMVAEALVPGLRESYLQQAARLLPGDAIGRIDASTLAASGSVSTVDVEVTGGPEPGRWLLLLQQIEGQWLILGTERA